MPNEPTPATGEFLLYQTEDGQARIECRFEAETIWLSQASMTELFQTTKQNISLHVHNIFAEGELDPESTVKEYLTVRNEGKRQVKRSVTLYRRWCENGTARAIMYRGGFMPD